MTGSFGTAVVVGDGLPIPETSTVSGRPLEYSLLLVPGTVISANVCSPTSVLVPPLE